jgi:sigma-B regulation protein RsbU (phosphoserine phosphatase)
MIILFLLSLIALICLTYINLRFQQENSALTLSLDKIRKEKDIVFSFLHEIGAAFNESQDIDTLLQSVLSAITRILKARGGCIFLVDDSGSHLQASIIEGIFSPWTKPDASTMEKILSKNKYLEEYLRAQKIPIGSGIIGQTAQSGFPSLIADATMDSRMPKYTDEVLKIKTMLSVPLKIKESTIGVLALVNKENNQSFTDTDLGLLQGLGDLASISINNARFNQAILEKQKLDCDLNIAKEIQHMLLPRTYPNIEHWDIGVLSRTAMEIGGDYYDFIDISNDKIGIVIADVSGKSIPGALVMSMTRSIMRSKATEVHSASGVLIAANELICQDIEQNMFISLAYIILDKKRNQVTYARAGHEPIIVYRAKDSSCEIIKPDGMVLGVTCDPSFNNCIKEVSFQIYPGDIIVMYTDGITESINEKQEEFGTTNLMDAVRISNKESAEDIVKNIIERVSRFTGDIPQRDDLTLVVLKLKG